MSFVFNQEHEAQFQSLIPRYPHTKSLVLPALWMVQYQEGYISSEAIAYLADRLDVPQAHLYSVATFYTMFNLEPIAPYHIQVCKTLSCDLCGKADIIKSIEDELGIKVGESTELFKLTEVECLGACGGAPMLAMNEKYYENLTPETTRALLKRLAQ
ncbi:NADH-quinone oxidoreductase subunit NuoE [Campylobacterota bacterium]